MKSMEKKFNTTINQLSSKILKLNVFLNLYHDNFYIIGKLEENNKTSCGSDWITYTDTKCFKVLDRKGTQSEAKNNCSAIDSTLITIGAENEQIFLSQHMTKYRGIAGNVWIGLEYVGNKFLWIDGNDMSYQNWDENAVKDGINKCVDMLIYESELGKWMDDRCTRKYLIACQKKQDSKTVLSEQVKNLTNVIEKQQNELKRHLNLLKDQQILLESHQNELINQNYNIVNLKSQLESQNEKHPTQSDKQQKEIDSLIPIGFVYTQLPDQSSPDVLWPNMKWTEVTQSYAGLFFRAEGGNSSSYGQLQLASAPRLAWISQYMNKWDYAGNNNIDLEQGIESERFYTGPGFKPNANTFSLSFKLSNEEVRPINKAVKIWTRTE